MPFTPGTGIDLIARTVGPKLAERFARPVVVDDRVGTSGNMDTEAVVRSASNSSTLLLSVNTPVMNRSLYPQLPFDPIKVFVLVALTSWGRLVLVSHPKTSCKTAPDWVAAANAVPGRVNYASLGVGTPRHVSMQFFKNRAGVYLTHLPCRRTSQAVTDLLGGQIETMVLPIHLALPYIKAGWSTALGIGSNKRSSLLSDVPTPAEAIAGKVKLDM